MKSSPEKKVTFILPEQSPIFKETTAPDDTVSFYREKAKLSGTLTPTLELPVFNFPITQPQKQKAKTKKKFSSKMLIAGWCLSAVLLLGGAAAFSGLLPLSLTLSIVLGTISFTLGILAAIICDYFYHKSNAVQVSPSLNSTAKIAQKIDIEDGSFDLHNYMNHSHDAVHMPAPKTSPLQTLKTFADFTLPFFSPKKEEEEKVAKKTKKRLSFTLPFFSRKKKEKKDEEVTKKPKNKM